MRIFSKGTAPATWRALMAFSSFILLGGLLFVEQSLKTNDTRQESEFCENQSRILSRNEELFIRLLNDPKNTNYSAIARFDAALAKRFKDQHFDLMVYKGDSCLFWTDNSITIDSCLTDIRPGASIIRTRNGYYQIFKKPDVKQDLIFLCLYLIKKEYAFQNQYLVSEFNPDFGGGEQGVIQFQRQAGFTDVKDTKGNYLFSERFIASKYREPISLVLIILLALIACVASIELWMLTLVKAGRWKEGFIVLTIGLLVFRAILFLTRAPYFLHEWSLFSPRYHASGYFIPSLGDLLFSLLCFVRLGYIVLAHGQWKIEKPRPWHIWICMGVFVCMSWTMIALIHSLVFDSNFTLDINNLFINEYSLWGLFALLIAMLAHFIWFRVLGRIVFHQAEFQHVVMSWMFLVFTAILMEGILTGFDGVRILMLVNYTAMLLWIFHFPRRVAHFRQQVYWFVSSSIITGLLVYYFNQHREIESRRLFAEHILESNDFKAERLFYDIERQITTDQVIGRYFETPYIPRENIVRRIRQFYFSGYMSRYVVNVYDYDAHGNPYKTALPFSNSELDSLYRFQSDVTEGNLFRRINRPGLLKGYLARFQFIDAESKDSNQLFVLMEPKALADENSFHELLSEGKWKEITNPYAYSYAIYRNGRLLQHAGDFDYPLIQRASEVNSDRLLTQDRGYGHLLVGNPAEWSILVSKKSDTLIEPLSLISFQLTFFFLVLVVFVLADLGMKLIGQLFTLRKGWQVFKRLAGLRFRNRNLTRDVNLSLMGTKLLASMSALVILTLVITAVINSNSIRTKYTENQTDKLVNKVSQVGVEIGASNDLGYNVYELDKLNYTVNRISDSYKTDINLYDLSGNLLITTQPRIIESGIISARMEPNAWRSLHLDGFAQYVQNESLGKLNYLSAYLPLFDKNQIPVAFLNLPNLSKEAELQTEIKANLLNLIQPYTFIFILVSLLAFLFTRTLTASFDLVREGLAQTALGRKNTKLIWSRSDEVGALIRQYNRMIDQLEQSADRLARSERDHAWKEMAKQIAHEIKNPLTPMKLQVQMLERAASSDDGRLPETVKKVTKTLVDQIDALALLATEFSSFAKMPTNVSERMDLGEVVRSATSLFALEDQVTLSCQIPDEPVWVYADRDGMLRVINNLLKNAIQAMEGMDVVRVDVIVSEKTDTVRLTVADFGVGIPESQRERIFEPNFSTKTSGMGLGLAIAKKIIDHAGGEIFFDSEVGVGTTFFVILPKA